MKFRYSLYLLAAIAVVLFIAANTNIVRAGIYCSAFIVLNMVVASYKRFVNLPIEIELLTLGIVVCTLKFGITAGLVVAVVGGIAGFITGFNISPFAFPMMVGYITMAGVAMVLQSFSITAVGIIASLINNALVFSMYFFVFKYNIAKNISFSASNLVLNIILFYNIAPLILSLPI